MTGLDAGYATELPERSGRVADVQRGGETLVRAVASVLLFFSATSPITHLVATVGSVSGGNWPSAVRLLVAVCSASLVMVGYAVLAGLPLRGVSLPVQRLVWLVVAGTATAFAPRPFAPELVTRTTTVATLILIVLAVLYTGWSIVRRPQVQVLRVSLQAVALVIFGQMLTILI